MSAKFGKLFALILVWPVSAALADETIGPWTVRATPIAAQTVFGTIGGWLNIVNQPVDVNEAFTGFSLIADGYANAGLGTVVELTYAPGTAINLSGPDLVFFDGRFSENSYVVSTDFDNFTAELELPGTVFADTGVDRTYFFELNSGGPFPADVMAAPIDLAALGVPANGSITKLRFRTTSSEADPLGVGSLVPEPSSLLLLTFAGAVALRRRTA